MIASKNEDLNFKYSFASDLPRSIAQIYGFDDTKLYFVGMILYWTPNPAMYGSVSFTSAGAYISYIYDYFFFGSFLINHAKFITESIIIHVGKTLLVYPNYTIKDTYVSYPHFVGIVMSN